MAQSTTEVPAEALTFLELAASRRTRRFALGSTMPPGGPLAHKSTSAPEPLSLKEEAALVIAGVGITGAALAELPFQDGPNGGGKILGSFAGRMVSSPDSVHAVSLILINDDGAWFIKRPQNLDAASMKALADDLRRPGGLQGDALLDIYKEMRVPMEVEGLAGNRPGLPKSSAYTPNFNQWADNNPGSTYILPVIELSEMYLSSLFVGLDKDMGYFLRDDRNNWEPAGIAEYARSTGKGELRDDDPARVFSVSYLESLITMLTTAELGGVLHNMNLMAHALRIGGWPHFAGHPAWLLRLGFESDNKDLRPRLSDRLGPKQAPNDHLKVPVVYALKNKKATNGSDQFLIRSYHPRNYGESAKETVMAFVNRKFGSVDEPLGKLRPGGGPSAWRQEVSVKSAIPEYSEVQIKAAIAHVDYMYRNYGRFPGCLGPITSLTAFQAHRIDPEFYSKFYKPQVTP